MLFALPQTSCIVLMPNNWLWRKDHVDIVRAPTPYNNCFDSLVWKNHYTHSMQCFRASNIYTDPLVQCKTTTYNNPILLTIYDFSKIYATTFIDIRNFKMSIGKTVYSIFPKTFIKLHNPVFRTLFTYRMCAITGIVFENGMTCFS